jgi:hypothetical protein
VQPGHSSARPGCSYGINRVSRRGCGLGPLLERLGRVHSREMVFKSFQVLRQV